MKSIAFIFCLLCAGSSFAQQKETFDLVTYTIPAGWKKASTTSNVVSLTITNNQKGTYCQIGVYASTTSKGSLQADFESEWQELIVKIYEPATKPDLVPAVSQNGWDAQGGVAPFEFSGAQSVAMLVTMSSHGRCLSIVILTNTEDYQAEIEKFLDSVDLKKIEAPSQPVNNNSPNNIDSPSVLGIWTMTSSGTSAWRMNNGVMDYIIRQYTLYENGTYTFITKAYDPLMDNILLGKENGTYQISGNNLTIMPQKSVLEAWSKKDGRDQWGTMLNSQNIALEKVTYQFTKHYMSGMQEWNLVLQAGAPTKREGPFSSNSSFSNAYYYSPISASHPIIELPVADNKSQAQQPVTNVNSAITGIWQRGKSATLYGGRWSSTGYQYSFNTDGTYMYIIKTYVEDDPETLLTRESGRFTIDGNTIILDPKTNVIEAWSKSNGGDNYKALITTQNKPLEKIAYQFTIQFIPELKETGLILLYADETARDGKYNSIASFPNGWRFSPAGPDYKPIKLPGE